MLFTEYRSLMKFREHYLFSLVRGFSVLLSGNALILSNPPKGKTARLSAQGRLLLLFFVSESGHYEFCVPDDKGINTAPFFLGRDKNSGSHPFPPFHRGFVLP